MWRDKVDQHNTGTPAYDHIERIIVERVSVQERLLSAPVTCNELEIRG
jgi:hypothetical protein